MEAGQGKYSPEHVKEILEAEDRTKAGPTARACGLTLLEIRYKSRITSYNVCYTKLLRNCCRPVKRPFSPRKEASYTP